MKINHLLFLFIIGISQIFAQTYPEVTIKDINFVLLIHYCSIMEHLNTEPKPATNW